MSCSLRKKYTYVLIYTQSTGLFQAPEFHFLLVCILYSFFECSITYTCIHNINQLHFSSRKIHSYLVKQSTIFKPHKAAPLRRFVSRFTHSHRLFAKRNLRSVIYLTVYFHQVLWSLFFVKELGINAPLI